MVYYRGAHIKRAIYPCLFTYIILFYTVRTYAYISFLFFDTWSHHVCKMMCVRTRINLLQEVNGGADEEGEQEQE